MAGGPMEAHSCGTVVDVLATALACPAVHTHAAVATERVEAGATILAGIRLQLALVHVLRTELACGTVGSHQPARKSIPLTTAWCPATLGSPVHSGGHWQL